MEERFGVEELTPKRIEETSARLADEGKAFIHGDHGAGFAIKDIPLFEMAFKKGVDVAVDGKGNHEEASER